MAETVLDAANRMPARVWQIATTCGDMIDRLPCLRCGATRLSHCKSRLTRDEIDATRDFINGYGFGAALKRAGGTKS